jgi:hypothetical protein
VFLKQNCKRIDELSSKNGDVAVDIYENGLFHMLGNNEIHNS